MVSDGRQHMGKEIHGMHEVRIDLRKPLPSLLAEGLKPPD
jgi:hypothetical protein